MTFSPRAIEAALAKFNEVINDPIMEPCPRCEAKGYHHGFGPGGVEPDWCENCGGNQYNIRPGEEKRAMESALSAALAVDGVALQDWQDIATAPKDGTRILLWAPAWYFPCSGSWYGSDWRQVYDMPAFANAPSVWMPLPPPPAASDGEERPSPPKEKP